MRVYDYQNPFVDSAKKHPALFALFLAGIELLLPKWVQKNPGRE
jgi:hypothetical protein